MALKSKRGHQLASTELATRTDETRQIIFIGDRIMYQNIVDNLITQANDLFKKTLDEGEHFDWFVKQLNMSIKLFQIANNICQIQCDIHMPNAGYSLHAALNERYQRDVLEMKF